MVTKTKNRKSSASQNRFIGKPKGLVQERVKAVGPELTRQWQQLNDVRGLFDKQIDAAETEMASFLVKTPYILRLTVTGINIVSAARLAGEAGPIEHYATARAINGRAGLHPSRYQSDEVDRPDGERSTTMGF